MKLKKYIDKKITIAKEKNGWKRVSKKRLKTVFSGNEKRNLKRAIDRHAKEFLTKSVQGIIDKLENIGVLKPPKKIGGNKKQPTPPPSQPTTTRQQIYKDEILFYELVQDLEDAFRNLFLKMCYIISQIGSASGTNVGNAIKEARRIGIMKNYSGDYISNVSVDVYIISYNGIKTEMEIEILESWEYQRKQKVRK